MARTGHPQRDDGHPEDSAMGEQPLVSLGQGTYRRDIMPDDVSPGHTKAEGDRAFTRLAQDIQNGTPLGVPPVRASDAYVPLADAKPAPLPTLKPITEQVRRLEFDKETNRFRNKAIAHNDQEEEYLRKHVDDLLIAAEGMVRAEKAGGEVKLRGEYLTLIRRVIVSATIRFQIANEDAEGGVS